MWSLDSMFGDIEAEFWKAHDEVMNATGFRNVLDSLSSSSSSPTAFFQYMRDEAVDFYKAVRWSEPFFYYLLAFHLLVWASVLYGTRGAVSDERLVLLCVALAAAVLAGMALNSLGSRHAARLFLEPGVNYFTEDGVFVAVVYMTPLMLLIVVLQIRMACRAVKLMVQVKGAQATRRLRREAKANAEAEAEGKKRQ